MEPIFVAIVTELINKVGSRVGRVTDSGRLRPLLCMPISFFSSKHVLEEMLLSFTVCTYIVSCCLLISKSALCLPLVLFFCANEQNK